ncbi:18792_t:CDS:2 [Funneliformis geosporum]|uniref:18792_t:CDS:1 n=1 Tax=Funneliformis geosporum TaxID=1117311 RepID=A0A9W4SIF6_9GLOM|nr:18792_t:CDS:2 [Funneliformis geosporum]
MIKLWETERLINFLRSDSKLEGLELDDIFFTKLCDENITDNRKGALGVQLIKGSGSKSSDSPTS